MPTIAPYILLGDDDVEDQELLVDRFLQANRHARFKLCKNGEEVLQYLLTGTAELPTILMLDYKMPLMTGADVLRHIHGDGRFGGIRKFVWSTSDHFKYIDECVTYGAEHYFVKPSSIEELDRIVSYLTGISETV